MRTATIKEIKDELSYCSTKQLTDLCLHLARFKKENKELLTYLLFNSNNESSYIQSVKEEMDEGFDAINYSSLYYVKKSVRKVLKNTKKYIRYSKKKSTEVELLIYYCLLLKSRVPNLTQSNQLNNLFLRQLQLIRKSMAGLHEDLQYDFEKELQKLKE
jgi:hypothetical protein